MPLAIFIIVSMAGFALAMARTSSQSNASAVQAAISIQAFYAADAGAQWGMNQLFYAGAPLTRTGVDASCSGMGAAALNFSVTGLDNCSSTIQCARATDPGNTTSYYTITSSAVCGGEPLLAERTVEVSAWMQ